MGNRSLGRSIGCSASSSCRRVDRFVPNSGAGGGLCVSTADCRHRGLSVRDCSRVQSPGGSVGEHEPISAHCGSIFALAGANPSGPKAVIVHAIISFPRAGNVRSHERPAPGPHPKKLDHPGLSRAQVRGAGCLDAQTLSAEVGQRRPIVRVLGCTNGCTASASHPPIPGRPQPQASDHSSCSLVIASGATLTSKLSM
jgi:hypothetical protein